MQVQADTSSGCSLADKGGCKLDPDLSTELPDRAAHLMHDAICAELCICMMTILDQFVAIRLTENLASMT